MSDVGCRIAEGGRTGKNGQERARTGVKQVKSWQEGTRMCKDVGLDSGSGLSNPGTVRHCPSLVRHSSDNLITYFIIYLRIYGRTGAHAGI